MNPEDFINELIGKTGISEDQGKAANDVFQSTFLSGNKDENFIVSQLSEKLGIEKSQAELIYKAGIGLLSTGILDKINPFKK